MSVQCRFGDDDNVELIKCSINEEDESITCPSPTLQNKLDGVEMNVTFRNQNGSTTTRTMVAKSQNEDQPLVSFQHETDSHSQRKVVRYGKEAVNILIQMLGELVGTLILILVICNAVCGAVIHGTLVGIWQVGVVCGIGAAISIYSVAHISDAHINPAITIAFAIVRFSSFSWKKVVPYITAQMAGGILGAAMFYAFNSEAIALFEEKNGIIRGENTSVLSAMVFGDYFPNPAVYNHSIPRNLEVMSLFGVFAVEAWATSILAFVVFSLTCPHNTAVGSKDKVMAPLIIGLTVGVLISIYGPLSQAGLNPARDLCPRIVAACAGWGTVAFPGPRAGFWAYTLGPIVGAVLGAVLYDVVAARAVTKIEKWKEEEEDNERPK